MEKQIHIMFWQIFHLTSKYETMYRLYVDQKEEWIKKTVINTAKSGYFSSDRTIEQYNEKIWNLKPVK